MKRAQLIALLDQYLDVERFHFDGARNGLQVDGATTVSRIGLAVDACLESFDAAAGAGCQLLITHHGLLWNEMPLPRGAHYRRLKRLIESQISLYVAHLPLDCHPEVGNNVQTARRMGLQPAGGFGSYKGVQLGLRVLLDSPQRVHHLQRRLREALDAETTLFAFGPDPVSTLGILTGAGGSMIEESSEEGIELLITGELSYSYYQLAKECGVNILCGGHYTTETVGVQALGEYIQRETGLETVFLPTPCPL